jgi:hypothetical protein
LPADLRVIDIIKIYQAGTQPVFCAATVADPKDLARWLPSEKEWSILSHLVFSNENGWFTAATAEVSFHPLAGIT